MSEEERETLERFVRRRKTAQQLATRSRVVLLCAEGHSNREVAAKVGVHETTVCKWRRRFMEKRLDGLLDEPRPGAPRKISDKMVERIVTTTLESTPLGPPSTHGAGIDARFATRKKRAASPRDSFSSGYFTWKASKTRALKDASATVSSRTE